MAWKVLQVALRGDRDRAKKIYVFFLWDRLAEKGVTGTKRPACTHFYITSRGASPHAFYIIVVILEDKFLLDTQYIIEDYRQQ